MGDDIDHATAARAGATLAGFRLGMWMALPVVPGMVAFGLAVGATAARGPHLPRQSDDEPVRLCGHVAARRARCLAGALRRRDRGGAGDPMRHRQRAHAADECCVAAVARHTAALADLSRPAPPP